MNKDQREIQRKLRILRHAKEFAHVAKTCRYFGVGRASFYRWRDAYRKHGENGLVNRPPIPKWHANRTPIEIEEKVLHLRKKYHLGPMRIVWYLARYHNIQISDATVSRMLKRNGVNRLPRGTRLRKVHTKRYNKQVPGHHIQMDVKFLTFKGKTGEKVRRFQFTAIDDATRVRALKIYEKHNQVSAIDFVNHIIEKFPFRIREIRTDNGHEFQAKFHWHVEDLGIRHAYIKRGTPQLEQFRFYVNRSTALSLCFVAQFI
jgi:transposase